jgi:transcriptional/translational regulatory protein YebC/TACO1
MSAEQLREDLRRAVQQAVAEDVPLDDIEAAIDDIDERVERLRVLEGGSA